LATLLDRGVVREVRDDRPHGLSAGEAAAYEPEIGFVRYFRDSPEQAFERYRRGLAVVVGAGALLPAVVRAGLRSGIGAVRAVITSECATDLDRLDAYADRGRRRVPAHRLERASAEWRSVEEAAGALR